MRYTSIIAALAMLASPGMSAQTTQKITASKATDNGIVYTLPATALDITLEAEITESKPGEFYNYAGKHLGIKDAITAPAHNVELKSATISTSGVANPASRWLMQFKAGQTPFLLLNEANVPLALNTDEVVEAETPELPKAVAAAPTALETPAAREAITQDMILSSSTSKRAELAAQRIFELRQSRSDLISGQADNTPPDGQSMQLALDNLSAQEAALTALFAGTDKRSTEVETIRFVPDSAQEVARKVIARISPVDGIINASDLSGEPVYLTVKMISSGELPLTEKGEARKFPKGGVAYNIPGTARVEVVYDGRTVAEADVEMAQFGVVFGLEPSLFTDKKAPSKLLFDPSTGGIRLFGPK